MSELEESVREKEQQIYNNLQSAAAQRAALTDSYTKTLEQTNASHTDASQVAKLNTSSKFSCTLMALIMYSLQSQIQIEHEDSTIGAVTKSLNSQSKKKLNNSSVKVYEVLIVSQESQYYINEFIYLCEKRAIRYG